MTNDASEPNSAPAAGMNARQLLEFYLVLPLAAGIFFGAASAGFQEFQTIGHRIAYLAIFSVVSWGCYGVGSRVSTVLLRPWHPSLLVVLLLGNVIGGFGLWWPLRDLLNLGFEQYLLPGSRFGPFWPPPMDNLGPYIAITLQGLLWWLLCNWVDFRFRRVPRFGFVPPQRPAIQASMPGGEVASAMATTVNMESTNAMDPGPAVPRLLGRLPEKLRMAEVIALQAEEHYTKVHTSAGSTLLLLRFSDAILEMEPQPGLQVHRSFWVSQHAIHRVDSAGRRMVIRMRGGLEVPVSRSYRLQVQGVSSPGKYGIRQG